MKRRTYHMSKNKIINTTPTYPTKTMEELNELSKLELLRELERVQAHRKASTTIIDNAYIKHFMVDQLYSRKMYTVPFDPQFKRAFDPFHTEVIATKRQAELFVQNFREVFPNGLAISFSSFSSTTPKLQNKIYYQLLTTIVEVYEKALTNIDLPIAKEEAIYTFYSLDILKRALDYKSSFEFTHLVVNTFKWLYGYIKDPTKVDAQKSAKFDKDRTLALTEVQCSKDSLPYKAQIAKAREANPTLKDFIKVNRLANQLFLDELQNNEYLGELVHLYEANAQPSKLGVLNKYFTGDNLSELYFQLRVIANNFKDKNREKLPYHPDALEEWDNQIPSHDTSKIALGNPKYAKTFVLYPDNLEYYLFVNYSNRKYRWEYYIKHLRLLANYEKQIEEALDGYTN